MKHNQTPSELDETAKARVTHSQLERVNLNLIPVMSANRGIPRKEQAKLARDLFKSLHVSHLSITTPNYSMAQSVHVTMPRRNDYETGEHGEYLDCEAVTSNNNARAKIREILARAFPNHGDHSDLQTDYHDYKWSLR
jgi:hypothetical protein